MQTTAGARLDPWKLEIIVVRGASRTSGERSAIGRDVERGLLARIAPACYVDRVAFESLTPERQHVVRVRAVDAASPQPLVLSHWSAAVLLGLPVLRTRLRTVHVTIPERSDLHRRGVTAHRHRLRDDDVIAVADVLTTAVERTVVDIAGASSFEEGVMAADRALLTGVGRQRLEDAARAAADRRAAARIALVVAFGDPGGESPAESRFRASSMRAGFEPPELQHHVRLPRGGDAWLDALYRRSDVGVEVDGEQKYLDADMAPGGAGRAVIREKRREDELRLGLRSLVRPGWVQSGSATLLRSLLAKADVHPTVPRTPVEAYIERARTSGPRPTWRPPTLEFDPPSLSPPSARSESGRSVQLAEEECSRGRVPPRA